MEPVAREFTEGHFHYRQIERTGNVAVYEQRHLHGGRSHFEVVRIRQRPAHTWPNGHTTPAHEAYPGSARWGIDGFTLPTPGAARAWLVRWVTTLATRDEQSPEEEVMTF